MRFQKNAFSSCANDCRARAALLNAGTMMEAPETQRVTSRRVACDGATDLPGMTALGHPRVWIEIDEKGYADCGYCDKRFVLIGSAADH